MSGGQRDETWWPEGTLPERMDNGAELDEHGHLNIGDPGEVRAKMRAWKLEHEAVLHALGLAVAGEPEPEPEEGLPPDMDEYDHLLEER